MNNWLVLGCRQRRWIEALAMSATFWANCSSWAQTGPIQAVKPFVSRPYKTTIAPSAAVMPLAAGEFPNLLRNPKLDVFRGDTLEAWRPWGGGFAPAPRQGRRGAQAISTARGAGDPERGMMQEVVLNQKAAAPLLLSGWSRAQEVSGTPNSDYSLYADITYSDGTHLWGQASEFRTGTHDWERAQVIIEPLKPIRSLNVLALFRGHSGKAWFCDLTLSSLAAGTGIALFDALPVRVAQAPKPAAPAIKYATRDGLSLHMVPGSGQVASLRVDGREMAAKAVPSGFLARDVANESGFCAFTGGASRPLQLHLRTEIESAGDHIAIHGRLSDTTGRDRAVSLAFALPIEARGWQWDDHVRASRRIEEGEFANTVPFSAGANGRLSLYPLAHIHNAQTGLALALDMNYAAQYRLIYNAATRQFFIIYDFGLAPEKPSAEFRFVLFRTMPRAGFRSALTKFHGVFPAFFQVRGPNKKQGLWMPFTNVATVRGWQDFGFRYHEGADDGAPNSGMAFDEANDILTFRYTEPMTWWMPMPLAEPRTYEAALARLQLIAGDPANPQYAPAQAVLSSGFRDENGRFSLEFRNTPWANGAVWSLNPSPKLPGRFTGARLLWSESIKARAYHGKGPGQLDGEYLDSLEGYVTANLNFDREQWKQAGAPLTFAPGSRTPAQHKAFLVYELTRSMSRDVHAMNKLMMANSVPYRFSFLTPWLDVMGTEENWLSEGRWTPPDDALMNLRRALCGARPYLMLQNTDFDKFTPFYVQKYFERCLFYGMFPSFFSADAATKPYWQNAAWYDRDRPLFKKYIPIIRAVAEAGWQAETLAASNNPSVWVERFGGLRGAVYLTLRNDAATSQDAKIIVDRSLPLHAPLNDLISGAAVAAQGQVLSIRLNPDQTLALRLS